MATYNGAKYLSEQLESFVKQTRQPDEVIITDDCSTDHTEIIVREFAKTAPFNVEFYRNNANLGYCGNFNAALTNTSGDLIFLSDQDDVWFPEKIEFMTKVAEKNPDALAVMNDAELTDGKLNPVGLTKLGQMESAGIGVNKYVMGCCCAVRRELLDLCLPIPDKTKGHDNWLITFAEGLAKKIVVRKTLQYYRRHDSNESQFIANSITPVSRIQSFKVNISRILTEDNRKDYEDKLNQQYLVYYGVDRALLNAESNNINKLQNMKISVLLEIDHQKERLRIIKKGGLARVFFASKLLVKGDYNRSNGFKSFLRDIVG
ncbi:glycosyltransferase family 2 protein [Idiomarina abyssalis]|uniref:glycosyltransferase family 2 protein n=1 Tax=Idiomarina abyssalis TaxID=86102 RepID=UPI0006C8B1AD|nr:glycosyltransferase family 2 protein [Idiomarina abyssalis]